jgi:hypothetical protein
MAVVSAPLINDLRGTYRTGGLAKALEVRKKQLDKIYNSSTLSPAIFPAEV